MNRRIITTLAVSAALLLAGCGSTGANEVETTPPASTPTQDETALPTSTLPDIIEPDETGEPGISDRLSGLDKDAYDGIAISAEILQRKAIIPGDVVPVTVLIKNTGDKTVRYTHGSGSAETPDALLVEAKGLQVVLPEDRLGPMTMDLQTKELKPGEELKFVANIMVIEPNSNFDDYTYEIHGKDKTYIGGIALPDLQKIYADIKAAATGTYDGKVYFTYSVEEAATDGQTPAVDFTSGDSAYAEADFKITVNE